MSCKFVFITVLQVPLQKRELICTLQKKTNVCANKNCIKNIDEQ